MAYEAYERFIEAAKQFPRWTNLRRRPNESAGGKILKSIIEEIAAVEDAIIEYKKDFFIVNYIGREDTIVDYIYAAHVGDIEKLDNFALIDPTAEITEEETVFYNNHNLALYKDGYIVLFDTNDTNQLHYTYNGYSYTANITKESVWNIIDEFAWWCGLERFRDERNKSLLQRCLYQLYYCENDPVMNRRPNSTEEGLKNAIVNAAHAKVDLLDTDKLKIQALEKEEIEFLEPNETTLALLNDDGITLYEEISQFNRDIARTRKWDMDYWDNAFRQLHYLPHQWDAEVDIYQNGVGYHDALQVTTADKVGAKNTTDVEIYGYNYSVQDINTYIQNHQITKDIRLGLTKYGNTFNPYSIQYKIVAEDLIPVNHPDQVWFTFFRQCREGWYDLDRLVKSVDENITVIKNGNLEADTEYTLTFTPGSEVGRTMEIERCDRIINGVRTSLLVEKDDFKWNGAGIINTSVLFHGDKIADFMDPVNLEDRFDAGFYLANPIQNASMTINLQDWCTGSNRQTMDIVVDSDSGWQDVTSSIIYVDQIGYEYNATENTFTSKNKLISSNESFALRFPENTCRRLKLTIEPTEEAIGPIMVNTKLLINGIEYENWPYAQIDLCSIHEIKFEQDDISNSVVLIIKRDTAVKIRISQILRTSYQFYLTTGYKTTREIIEGTETKTIEEINIVEELNYNPKNSITLPQLPENSYLWIRISNAGNPNSPIIKYIHIGPVLRKKKYTITVPAETSVSELDIRSNCAVSLYNARTGNTISDYTTHNAYSGDGDITLDLSLFTSIIKSEPAVKQANIYGENAYYFHLNSTTPITQIWIQGTGYQSTTRMSLQDIVKLKANETVYFTRSWKRFAIKSPTGSRLVDIIHKKDLPQSDKVEITSQYNPHMQACFETQSSHIGKSYTGNYDIVYLYDMTAKEYIAYNTENLVKEKTENVSIIPSFSPEPKEMAQLSYYIEEIIPNDGVSVVFESTNTNKSLKNNDTLIIDIAALGSNTLDKKALEVVSSSVAHNTRLSNIIYLKDIIQNQDLYAEIGTYNITPPNGMEIVYNTKTYPQDAHEDGSAMYVENDGFNKLKHANIIKIIKIKLGNNTYQDVQLDNIMSLMKEEGIIQWKNPNLYGQPIHLIEYEYKHPEAIRFKDISLLYSLSGYKISSQKNINLYEYTVSNKSAGDIIKIDPSYFNTEDNKLPDIVIAKCTNPCYSASVSNGLITLQRIAEDRTPVIHNGFYYVDGTEYYFFSKEHPIELNRMEGVSIDNGKMIGNMLYLYKEATNYLENSKMECNHLDVHCIVDFNKPRARTNIDPIGHIGACESFSAWEDYGVNRVLTTYKNGQATRFIMQQDGYALLDITPYLKNHTTISCLFNGQSIRFELAREIRIMNEQALKTVYCETIQPFIIYQDIAYCIVENLEVDKYRYYLVVKGDGVLDEVLIHDLREEEDIAKHHIKAIDKLGFTIPETNTVKNTTAIIEYTPMFMKYNQLETDAEQMLRTGTTADWNITKLTSFDLSQCTTTKILRRNNGLVAQAENATLQTVPFEIKYQRSIRRMAVKVNQYIDGNKKGFTIRILTSPSRTGSYAELICAYDKNIVEFAVDSANRFIKVEILAKEEQVITDIGLFAIYKEVPEEDLNIFYYNDGSAVTKVFDIGSVGTYRFNRIICEEGYDNYQDIHVRGAKKMSSGEYIWTAWMNTSANSRDNLIFEGYSLFQFKIRLSGKDTKVRIKAFEFEVL